MPIMPTFTFSLGEPFAKRSFATKNGAAAAAAKVVLFIKLLLSIFESFISTILKIIPCRKMRQPNPPRGNAGANGKKFFRFARIVKQF